MTYENLPTRFLITTGKGTKELFFSNHAIFSLFSLLERHPEIAENE